MPTSIPGLLFKAAGGAEGRWSEGVCIPYHAAGGALTVACFHCFIKKTRITSLLAKRQACYVIIFTAMQVKFCL